METKLFYAKEVHYIQGEAAETVYVRFDRKDGRDHWLKQGTVADSALALKQWLSTKPTDVLREPLRSNSAEVKMLGSTYTWEYIDGVSYGNKRG